jgi:putative SOS response-associated peptidase YedK
MGKGPDTAEGGGAVAIEDLICRFRRWAAARLRCRELRSARDPRQVRNSHKPVYSRGFGENWRDPLTGKWKRTFAVVTVPANELVGQIHDRMLAILPNDRFARWLSDEADPRELLVPFPADKLAVSPQRSRR